MPKGEGYKQVEEMQVFLWGLKNSEGVDACNRIRIREEMRLVILRLLIPSIMKPAKLRSPSRVLRPKWRKPPEAEGEGWSALVNDFRTCNEMRIVIIEVHRYFWMVYKKVAEPYQMQLF